jgi:hypothetical protein
LLVLLTYLPLALFHLHNLPMLLLVHPSWLHQSTSLQGHPLALLLFLQLESRAKLQTEAQDWPWSAVCI